MRTVILLLLAYISFSMFRLSVGVAIPEIMLEYSINEAQAGLLYSAPLWSTAILLTPSGYLADRFGQRKILLFGYLILAIGVTAIGFSQSYLESLASLAMAGAGGGILVPSYYSSVGEALKKIRGFAIGLAAGVYYFGGLFGSILVGFFAAQHQWRIAYYVVGIIIFIMVAAQFVGVRPSSTVAKRTVGVKTYSSFIRILRTRNIFVATISIFLSSVGFFSATAWLPTFLLTIVGLDAANVGIVFGFFMLFGGVGSLVLGAVSDKIGRRWVTCVSGIISAGISIPMFMTQFSFWPAIAYSVAFGFFLLPFWNLLVTIAQESVSKEFVSSATGVTQTFGLVGSALGPAIAGVLIVLLDITQALIYSITLPVLSYGLLALIMTEVRRRT